MTTTLITGTSRGLCVEVGRQLVAEAIVRYALITPDGPNGGFLDRNGAGIW
jgi:hypothetical protein